MRAAPHPPGGHATWAAFGAATRAALNSRQQPHTSDSDARAVRPSLRDISTITLSSWAGRDAYDWPEDLRNHPTRQAVPDAMVQTIRDRAAVTVQTGQTNCTETDLRLSYTFAAGNLMRLLHDEAGTRIKYDSAALARRQIEQDIGLLGKVEQAIFTERAEAIAHEQRIAAARARLPGDLAAVVADRLDDANDKHRALTQDRVLIAGERRGALYHDPSEAGGRNALALRLAERSQNLLAQFDMLKDADLVEQGLAVAGQYLPNWKPPKSATPRGTLARLSRIEFWIKQLGKIDRIDHLHAHACMDMLGGGFSKLGGRFRVPHLPSKLTVALNIKRQTQLDYAACTVMTASDGTQRTLAEITKHAARNQLNKIRILTLGLALDAKQRGLKPRFVTITTPSRFHPTTTVKLPDGLTIVEPNPRFDPMLTAKDSADWLQSRRADWRSAIRAFKDGYAYICGAEFHASGTVHYHMLLWTIDAAWPEIRARLDDYFLYEKNGKEQLTAGQLESGAREHRIEIREVGEGGDEHVVAYVLALLAYLTKNTEAAAATTTSANDENDDKTTPPVAQPVTAEELGLLAIRARRWSSTAISAGEWDWFRASPFPAKSWPAEFKELWCLASGLDNPPPEIETRQQYEEIEKFCRMTGRESPFRGTVTPEHACKFIQICRTLDLKKGFGEMDFCEDSDAWHTEADRVLKARREDEFDFATAIAPTLPGMRWTTDAARGTSEPAAQPDGIADALEPLEIKMPGRENEWGEPVCAAVGKARYLVNMATRKVAHATRRRTWTATKPTYSDVTEQRRERERFMVARKAQAKADASTISKSPFTQLSTRIQGGALRAPHCEPQRLGRAWGSGPPH